MQFFLTDGMIQEESLYVYNIHNIVENTLASMLMLKCKVFAHVRNRGGSLAFNNFKIIVLGVIINNVHYRTFLVVYFRSQRATYSYISHPSAVELFTSNTMTQ
jgi:hypothetical protein